MSEGGYLLWKRQKLRIPPTANYSDLKKPLSLPPGKTWCRDVQTNEWKVVDVVPLSSSECDNDVTVVATDDAVVDVVAMESETTTATATATATGGDHVVYHPHSPVEHVLLPMVAQEAVVVMPLPLDQSPCSRIGDSIRQQQQHGNDHDTGVKELYHLVQPSDTLQGICLRYGITPTELRQSNMFSGSNLALAPSRLRIPLPLSSDKKRTMKNNSQTCCKNPTSFQHYQQSVLNHTMQERQYKIQLFNSILGQKLSMMMATTAGGNVPSINNKQVHPVVGKQETIAYLEMNQWDVHQAVGDALQDWKWEQQVNK